VDSMNENERVPERLQGLIDGYLDGCLDEAQTRELEECLSADADLRAHFARYAHLHVDLHLEARALGATERVVERIEQSLQGRTGSPGHSRLLRWVLATAACLLLAAGAWWLAVRRDRETPGGEPAIAWLVNAQNCQWTDSAGPVGDLRAGTRVRLERGLAEVRFECGARVVLEGPAQLELLSGHSGRLLRGKLTAHVPTPQAGFEIVSPQGKVIDLGTEFGISVADNGATEVYVFEGKVEARATPGQARAVSLTQNQGARIANGQVTLRSQASGGNGRRFVRAIVPPPVVRPRTLRLAFDRAVAGSIGGADGFGTGLTHRLPGTGTDLPPRDSNLRLNTARGQLELTTTNSDVNTQYQLHHGEYLGVRLADLGFTGTEDFAVSTTFLNIPALEFVGQFGLYAGARSDRNIRGGVIGRRQFGQYTQFLVNNHEGKDVDVYRVGLLSTGADLRLTLKRARGKYSLTVENLTAGSSSALAIRHPHFLDGERDLLVGLFGANTQSEVRKTLTIKEFAVTVWTVASPVGGTRKE
jgi:ferric-dicitrate binding protein FerR (iron transport regulator)